MGGRARPARTPPRGQHLLADRRLAADLVQNAGVTRADLVLEIGAGTGVLTSALAERAGRVLAFELDEGFVRALHDRFADSPNVAIVHADALEARLPTEPYRVVANLPFGITTPLLRRLLDPTGTLLRADVVVQWGFAIKRARQRPSTLLTLSWTPWFELTIGRRIPRRRFRPPPAVDAAVLTVTRRPDPLLPADERHGYLDLLRTAFSRASTPVAETLRGAVGPEAVKDVLRRMGLPGGVRPTDLDAAGWAALYAATRPRRPRSSGDGRGTGGHTSPAP